MGTTRPYRRIRSAADVNDTADRLGSYFFSPGAMHFFSSRLSNFHSVIEDTEGGTQSGLIITTDRYGHDAPRHATLRRYTIARGQDSHGPVDSISFDTIARFPSRRAAENGAAILTGSASDADKAAQIAAFAIDGEVEL